ncbi:hypothetical protein AK88_05512 [Plasmodium fragile]|uniref:Variable surface protein n=1 Tax=Plasmodium fragile TaxID=5857 RepID=A0A0D9QDF2_PLAFR|nr:uncharacterized protein AK88_05512 [Plasmodium fragile]KJP84857.1 hypothetical protein AK88_05512 [Plasmodium fragile]
MKNVEFVRDDNDDAFRRKHCFDINYWLYDEVHKKLQSTDKENDFQNIMNLFDGMWKRFINHSYDVNTREVCFPNATLFRDNFLEYLKRVKNFMDYIEDYYFIKGEIGKSTYYACEVYFDYLKERIPLYLAFGPLCRKQGSNTCTNYILGYSFYDPKHLVTKSQALTIYGLSWLYPCYNKIVHLFNDYENARQKFIGQYAKYVKPFIDAAEQRFEKLAQRGTVKNPLPVENVEVVDVAIPTHSEQPTGVPSKLYSHDGISQTLKTEQPVPWIKIGVFTLLSALSITMLVTALMKFTPLGNLFSRRRKRIRRELQYSYYSVAGDSIFGSYNSLSTNSDEGERSIAYGAM